MHRVRFIIIFRLSRSNAFASRARSTYRVACWTNSRELRSSGKMAGISNGNLQQKLSRYNDVISALSSKKKYKKGEETLEQLDNWYQKKLPESLAGKNPRALTGDELAKIMRWKLKRGKFRPKLQSLVESNPQDLVSRSTSDAVKCLPDIEKAIETLTALKGVGPATASAILSSYAPNDVPFMADEAVEAVLGKVSYTMRGYMEFVEEIKKLANKLNRDEGTKFWTAHKLELALWCSAQCSKLGIEIPGGQGGQDNVVDRECSDPRDEDGEGRSSGQQEKGDVIGAKNVNSDRDDPPKAKRTKR